MSSTITTARPMDWIVRQENLHQEFPSTVSTRDSAIFGDFRICIIHPAQTLRYIFWKKHADLAEEKNRKAVVPRSQPTKMRRQQDRGTTL